MRRARHLLTLAAYMLIGFAVVSPSVAAVDANTENISQSYSTDKELKAGTIVSTLSGNADYVEPTNTENASRIIGVVVKADSSLVAVNPDEVKAQVGTSGSVSVLVSTVNGTIKAGDKIAPSPFSGIGMKAVGNGYIAGSALTNFNENSDGAVAEQVTDKNGARRTITVGYVEINLTPRFDSSSEDAGLSGLQRFVRSLTGHAVSTPRIIVSLVIAILTIVAIVVLMYAGIYGSIVSIGRNPLARVSIFRALTRVLAMALLAFAVSLSLIYLLLR